MALLQNTPLWVYLLLAYLVWQGLQSLRPRTQPVWRRLIVPLVFIALGLSRIVQGDGGGTLPLLAWLAAALVFAPLAVATGPRLLAVDRSKGLVTLSGSVFPLIRNVTVFVVQYAVAVAAARHLDGQGVVAIAGRAVSGATAGYFIGWSIVFLIRYRKAGAA